MNNEKHVILRFNLYNVYSVFKEYPFHHVVRFEGYFSKNLTEKETEYLDYKNKYFIRYFCKKYLGFKISKKTRLLYSLNNEYFHSPDFLSYFRNFVGDCSSIERLVMGGDEFIYLNIPYHIFKGLNNE